MVILHNNLVILNTKVQNGGKSLRITCLCDPMKSYQYITIVRETVVKNDVW